MYGRCAWRVIGELVNIICVACNLLVESLGLPIENGACRRIIAIRRLNERGETAFPGVHGIVQLYAGRLLQLV